MGREARLASPCRLQWTDRLALPTQGPQSLAGSSIHVTQARLSFRGHLPPCQPLDFALSPSSRWPILSFSIFCGLSGYPQMEGPSPCRVFFLRPSCVISRVIICIGHDMRDSQSRMFGTHRLLFEEDLQMVASRHGRWLTCGRKQAS